MGKLIDLTGQRFGRLTVVGFAYKDKYGHSCWNCLCDCKSSAVIGGGGMRSGRTRSCGCLRQEITVKRFTIHGKSHTPEHQAWRSMIGRSNGVTPNVYKNYTLRGITVCDRWLNGDGNKSGFECFFEDMGKKPGSGFSLDRRDNDDGYSPDNCRWVTGREQHNNKRTNRRVTYLGRTQTLTQWALTLKLSYAALKDRLDRGWSIERAFTQPVQKRQLKRNGVERDGTVYAATL